MAEGIAQQLIRAWELGEGRPAWSRAIALLTLVLPDESYDALMRLSIGRRNAYLLVLRMRLWGPRLNARTACPRCGEALEFALHVPDICTFDPAHPLLRQHTIQVDGFQVKLRLLNSLDVAAAAQTHDADHGRRVLLERSMEQVTYLGEAVALADVPPHLIDTLGERYVELDPLSELRLGLACAACQYQWTSLFDIVAFLWMEVTWHAKGLLADVVTLAQAYGWNEADILRMSPARRTYYLEQISA